LALIINADDFGRTSEINRAVIRAHRDGILNSASLMIGAEAADEAVELARQNPALAVGLHLVAVDGRSVLPKPFIPGLVDDRGRLANTPARLGLRYAFSRSVRSEIVAELSAQFERFASTGLPLSHVDGHQHMHMHPVLFRLIVPLAKNFGAHRIRIVQDDLRLALRYDRRGAAGKLIATGVFAVLAPRCRRLCEEAGLSYSTRTYGFLQSGAMAEKYVLAALQQSDIDSSEIYFHPTESRRLDNLGPNPGDLETLLSDNVRAALAARDNSYMAPNK
jgi:hopanoid biosynthesis associated protein HpnK